MSKRSKTAAELMRELQNDPEWVRQDAERQANHRALVEKERVEMKPEMDPLVIALREAGFEFESISDFVNTDQPYPDAIPIFVRYLPKVQHPTLRAILARSLTVPEARGLAGEAIVRELMEKDDSEYVRSLLAFALTYTATSTELDSIRQLLADPRNEDIRRELKAAARKALKK